MYAPPLTCCALGHGLGWRYGKSGPDNNCDRKYLFDNVVRIDDRGGYCTISNDVKTIPRALEEGRCVRRDVWFTMRSSGLRGVLKGVDQNHLKGSNLTDIDLENVEAKHWVQRV
ncbi:hypothetical protein AVEN_65372-1 [Araneus ventricosus]|uniref:Uncharacterized protein n=1 Tax=Araneus ventricosus TaxID=182803 RepID=A0A4Y2I191_ARAVE|nr:hypothetical protein AVEN_65372-1 [Araneus ventricosus]